MNKITTIHLNGIAYQIEEPGYETLKSYLEKAKLDLKDNPDKAEIVSDLEQAIGDKCRIYLNNHKNVILSAEIKKITDEMGPIKADAPFSDTGKTSGSENTTSDKTNPAGPKRLYQIREGALISGVCNGIAAYFNIDVTVVRILFVALGIFTGGAFVIVYILMMFFVPFADTPEEKASAYDMPLTAQELVNRAKENYARFRDNGGFNNPDTQAAWKHEWHKKHHEWRKNRRAWKHNMKREMKQRAYQRYPDNSVIGVLRPLIDTFVALVWIGLFVLLVFFIARHHQEFRTLVSQAGMAIHEFIAWAKATF